MASLLRIILYTMKVSKQKVSRQVVHLQKTLAQSHILSLKSIFEQHHLELSYKKFHGPCKNCKIFMVYGNYIYYKWECIAGEKSCDFGILCGTFAPVYK